MAVIIDMPKLSDTMTTGTLVNWLVNEGDTVSVGDMIAEVETDKATMELENFEDGVLLKQYIKAGDTVNIGTPIAAIGEAGEEVPTPPAAPAKEEQPAKEEPAPVPAAKAPAPAPQVAAVTAAPAAPVPDLSSNGRIKASPLARKMAAAQGIDLSQVSGTGPHGRIVKADILNFTPSATAPAPAPAASASAPAAQPAGPVMALAAESIPVTNMRRTIADVLTQSKTTIPHFYLNIEVDAAPLIQLRKNLNSKLADLPPEHGGIKFTINDLILKATAEAIRRVPGINASWQGQTIERYADVDLGFGVAIDEGLVTPVVRGAQNLSLRQLSLEAKSLVGKARSKKLAPNEMTGATFLVTNLGMYDINNFYGIISPPNAGILSVGATVKKPVFDANDNVVPGYRMNIGFSGDHRVIDGATGAEFLKALRDILETPETMLA